MTTTLATALLDDLTAYPQAGCTTIELWLTKLEQALERISPGELRKRWSDSGLRCPAAAYQGGLLLTQGDERRVHFEHFKRRLDLCQSLQVPVLCVVADFIGPVTTTDLERAVVSLAQAAQWAAGFGVRLALEFRGTSTFCNNLDTALALVAQCGEDNVGVCLDMFHFYQGPSKFEDLGLLTPKNLAHVQVCDVAGVPRELMSDSDRVMPGDGDFRLEPLIARLRQIGYTGAIALELFNPTFWQMKPTQVVEIGWTALQQLLA
jgi:sugar phosphate isomerase/epimerase